VCVLKLLDTLSATSRFHQAGARELREHSPQEGSMGLQRACHILTGTGPIGARQHDQDLHGHREPGWP
jgi:hypothetical protein